MTINDTINGWFDSVKNFFKTFDLNAWVNDIAGSSAPALQGAIYFGISVVVGYVTKRYFKIILGSLILAAVLIKSMEYLDLLTINWTHVQSTSGVDTNMSLNALTTMLFEKIKDNILLFAASATGFLVGYKLG